VAIDKTASASLRRTILPLWGGTGFPCDLTPGRIECVLDSLRGLRSEWSIVDELSHCTCCLLHIVMIRSGRRAIIDLGWLTLRGADQIRSHPSNCRELTHLWTADLLSRAIGRVVFGVAALGWTSQSKSCLRLASQDANPAERERHAVLIDTAGRRPHAVRTPHATSRPWSATGLASWYRRLVEAPGGASGPSASPGGSAAPLGARRSYPANWK